jgi:ribonuclease HI
MLEIYTDGACSGNPGPGGWGVLIYDGERELELQGGEALTTNNRMEMTAAIEALKATSGPVILHTDSQYLRNGVTDWMQRWKRNGWRTADRKPVKNQDLWEALDVLSQGRRIEWRWVRGHAGDIGNERADALARQGLAAVAGQPSL